MSKVKKELSPFEAAQCEPDFSDLEEANMVKCKAIDEIPTEVTTLTRVAPQYIVTNQLCAFLDDPEITITGPSPIYDKSGYYEVEIASANYHKITAIAKAFKSRIYNVYFTFKYKDVDNDYVRTLTDIFTGNAHFDNIRVAHDAMGGLPVVITTFKDETVQYKADNRFVPGGYSTTLAENLVTEFFKEDYRKSVYVTKDKNPYAPDPSRVADDDFYQW